MRAKKSLGQNFLVDERYLVKIAELCIAKDDACQIVEIGPGTCNLTKHVLALRQNPYLAIEVDARAAEYLQNLKDTYANFDFKISDACKENYADACLVFGNLPYNVGTKILLQCCQQAVPKMVFLLQAEVVDRICAKHDTEHYGSLSVLMQVYYNVKSALKIPPDAFSPRPKIQSKLLICERKNTEVDYASFSALLREAFQYPRKMIGNNIANLPSNIDPKRRPGNFSVDEYVALNDLFKSNLAYN